MIFRKRNHPETAARLQDRLRNQLRAGDPAAGGGGLAPEEVWEMRRRMLAEIPERRPRLLLGLASAAAAALALALGLALHREVPPPAPIPPAVLAPAPAPAIVTSVPGAVPEPAAPPPAERSGSPTPRYRHYRPAVRAALPPAEPAAAPAPPSPAPVTVAAEPPAPLQIQFDTPGGTRVIWVLEPTKP